MALHQRERDVFSRLGCVQACTYYVSEGNQPLGAERPGLGGHGQRWDSRARKPSSESLLHKRGSEGGNWPSMSHWEPSYSHPVHASYCAYVPATRSRCNVVGPGWNGNKQWPRFRLIGVASRPTTLEGVRHEAKWKRSSRAEANQQATAPDATQCPAGCCWEWDRVYVRTCPRIPSICAPFHKCEFLDGTGRPRLLAVTSVGPPAYSSHQGMGVVA